MPLSRGAARAQRLAPYLAIAVGLAAVYWPALRSDFLFNDDYANVVEPPPYAWILGSAGRPVQYLLVRAAHELLVRDAANVFVLRGLLFAAWLSLAAVLFHAVRRGLGEANAAALVLFLFSVPAYLITFAWVSVAVNIPAYLAAAASYATGYLLLGRARTGVARWLLASATVALVAIASLTYQIAAVLPLALVVYHLLFEARDRRALRGAAVTCALVCTGLVLALVAAKVTLRVLDVPIDDRFSGTMSRLSSPRALLLPFRIFGANFALHYYYWGWLTREAALVLGAAASIVVVRAIWGETAPSHPDHRENRGRWAVIAAAAFVGGMIFALDASRELRSKPFLTLLVLFVVLWAVRETPAWTRFRARRAAAWAIVAITMWSGRDTLSTGLVTYAEGELAHVQRALAGVPPGALRRVHVVQPENHCFSPPCYGWFEFNVKLASSQEWVPRGMVRHALVRMGRGGEQVATTFSRSVPEQPGLVVVDMRELERRLQAEHGETMDLSTFLKRRGTFGPADAVGLSGLWITARRAY